MLVPLPVVGTPEETGAVAEGAGGENGSPGGVGAVGGVGAAGALRRTATGRLGRGAPGRLRRATTGALRRRAAGTLRCRTWSGSRSTRPEYLGRYLRFDNCPARTERDFVPCAERV